LGQLLDLPGIRVRGLMTMAPPVEQPDDARPVLSPGCGSCAITCAAQYPDDDWSHLSMGMTDDFEAGILEGATLVRIGRAIFGPRQP
jgi:uncharacterized pyridoxal phosphate-containing UPF0001 family protein